MDGQGTKCHRNIAENLNRLSRVHERYRRQTDRQTDGRQQIANVKFTFAKNQKRIYQNQDNKQGGINKKINSLYEAITSPCVTLPLSSLLAILLNFSLKLH